MFHPDTLFPFAMAISKQHAKKFIENGELMSLFVNRIKNVAIFTLNTDGEITSWNPAAARLFGYRGKDVIGKSLTFLFPNLNGANKLHTDLQTALDMGQYTHETTIVTKSGKRIWVNCIVTALWDKDKKLQGFSKVVENITDRKERDTLRSEYMSIIGHELKNPLTSVKSYLQLLQLKLKKNHNATTVSFTDKALSQLDKLSNLMNDLLDSTKMDIGILKYHDEDKVSITVLLRELVDLLTPTTPDFTFKIKGKVNKDIYIDKIRVEQVINNLLINAVKYSPKGSTITIYCSQTESEILIGIQDQGIGISDKDKERIFERFQRLPEAKELSAGLGLGLYLASQIVFHYKGKLWVESQKGKGSTFYFTLPLQLGIKG